MLWTLDIMILDRIYQPLYDRFGQDGPSIVTSCMIGFCVFRVISMLLATNMVFGSLALVGIVLFWWVYRLYYYRHLNTNGRANPLMILPN